MNNLDNQFHPNFYLKNALNDISKKVTSIITNSESNFNNTEDFVNLLLNTINYFINNKLLNNETQNINTLLKNINLISNQNLSEINLLFDLLKNLDYTKFSNLKTFPVFYTNLQSSREAPQFYKTEDLLKKIQKPYSINLPIFTLNNLGLAIKLICTASSNNQTQMLLYTDKGLLFIKICKDINQTYNIFTYDTLIDDIGTTIEPPHLLHIPFSKIDKITTNDIIPQFKTRHHKNQLNICVLADMNILKHNQPLNTLFKPLASKIMDPKPLSISFHHQQKNILLPALYQFVIPMPIKQNTNPILEKNQFQINSITNNILQYNINLPIKKKRLKLSKPTPQSNTKNKDYQDQENITNILIKIEHHILYPNSYPNISKKIIQAKLSTLSNNTNFITHLIHSTNESKNLTTKTLNNFIISNNFKENNNFLKTPEKYKNKHTEPFMIRENSLPKLQQPIIFEQLNVMQDIATKSMNQSQESLDSPRKPALEQITKNELHKYASGRQTNTHIAVDNKDEQPQILNVEPSHDIEIIKPASKQILNKFKSYSEMHTNIDIAQKVFLKDIKNDPDEYKITPQILKDLDRIHQERVVSHDGDQLDYLFGKEILQYYTTREWAQLLQNRVEEFGVDESKHKDILAQIENMDIFSYDKTLESLKHFHNRDDYDVDLVNLIEGIKIDYGSIYKRYQSSLLQITIQINSDILSLTDTPLNKNTQTANIEIKKFKIKSIDKKYGDFTNPKPLNINQNNSQLNFKPKYKVENLNEVDLFSNIFNLVSDISNQEKEQIDQFKLDSDHPNKMNRGKLNCESINFNFTTPEINQPTTPIDFTPNTQNLSIQANTFSDINFVKPKSDAPSRTLTKPTPKKSEIGTQTELNNEQMCHILKKHEENIKDIQQYHYDFAKELNRLIKLCEDNIQKLFENDYSAVIQDRIKDHEKNLTILNKEIKIQQTQLNKYKENLTQKQQALEHQKTGFYVILDQLYKTSKNNALKQLITEIIDKKCDVSFSKDKLKNFLELIDSEYAENKHIQEGWGLIEESFINLADIQKQRTSIVTKFNKINSYIQNLQTEKLAQDNAFYKQINKINQELCYDNINTLPTDNILKVFWDLREECINNNNLELLSKIVNRAKNLESDEIKQAIGIINSLKDLDQNINLSKKSFAESKENLELLLPFNEANSTTNLSKFSWRVFLKDIKNDPDEYKITPQVLKDLDRIHQERVVSHDGDRLDYLFGKEILQYYTTREWAQLLQNRVEEFGMDESKHKDILAQIENMDIFSYDKTLESLKHFHNRDDYDVDLVNLIEGIKIDYGSIYKRYQSSLLQITIQINSDILSLTDTPLNKNTQTANIEIKKFKIKSIDKKYGDFTNPKPLNINQNNSQLNFKPKYKVENLNEVDLFSNIFNLVSDMSNQEKEQIDQFKLDSDHPNKMNRGKLNCESINFNFTTPEINQPTTPIDFTPNTQNLSIQANTFSDINFVKPKSDAPSKPLIKHKSIKTEKLITDKIIIQTNKIHEEIILSLKNTKEIEQKFVSINNHQIDFSIFDKLQVNLQDQRQKAYNFADLSMIIADCIKTQESIKSKSLKAIEDHKREIIKKIILTKETYNRLKHLKDKKFEMEDLISELHKDIEKTKKSKINSIGKFDKPFYFKIVKKYLELFENSNLNDRIIQNICKDYNHPNLVSILIQSNQQLEQIKLNYKNFYNLICNLLNKCVKDKSLDFLSITNKFYAELVQIYQNQHKTQTIQIDDMIVNSLVELFNSTIINDNNSDVFNQKKFSLELQQFLDIKFLEESETFIYKKISLFNTTNHNEQHKLSLETKLFKINKTIENCIEKIESINHEIRYIDSYKSLNNLINNDDLFNLENFNEIYESAINICFTTQEKEYGTTHNLRPLLKEIVSKKQEIQRHEKIINHSQTELTELKRLQTLNNINKINYELDKKEFNDKKQKLCEQNSKKIREYISNITNICSMPIKKRYLVMFKEHIANLYDELSGLTNINNNDLLNELHGLFDLLSKKPEIYKNEIQKFEQELLEDNHYIKNFSIQDKENKLQLDLEFCQYLTNLKAENSPICFKINEFKEYEKKFNDAFCEIIKMKKNPTINEQQLKQINKFEMDYSSLYKEFYLEIKKTNHLNKLKIKYELIEKNGRNILPKKLNNLLQNIQKQETQSKYKITQLCDKLYYNNTSLFVDCQVFREVFEFTSKNFSSNQHFDILNLENINLDESLDFSVLEDSDDYPSSLKNNYEKRIEESEKIFYNKNQSTTIDIYKNKSKNINTPILNSPLLNNKNPFKQSIHNNSNDQENTTINNHSDKPCNSPNKKNYSPLLYDNTLKKWN